MKFSKINDMTLFFWPTWS